MVLDTIETEDVDEEKEEVAVMPIIVSGVGDPSKRIVPMPESQSQPLLPSIQQ